MHRRIFEMTGLGVNSSLLQSAVIGGTNLIFTMIAMSIIDRFGRRSLADPGFIRTYLFPWHDRPGLFPE